MKSIELLESADIYFLENLKTVNFDKTVKSSYAPDRLEAWFGYGSNLQSIKDGRSEVIWIQDFPEWMNELRTKYFPDSNSCLVCKGTKSNSDTSIEWHRDHGNF